MAKVRVKKGHNLFSAVIFNNTMRRRSFSELTLPETSITEFKVCFYPPGVKPSQLSGSASLPSASIWKKPSATREIERTERPHCALTIIHQLSICKVHLPASTVNMRSSGKNKKLATTWKFSLKFLQDQNYPNWRELQIILPSPS